jgi:hypothetical protein
MLVARGFFSPVSGTVILPIGLYRREATSLTSGDPSALGFTPWRFVRRRGAGLCGLPVPFLSAVAVVEDAKARRLLAGGVEVDALHRQAALQKLADRCGSARHPLGEPPIIQHADFAGAKHDLQAFRPAEVSHDAYSLWDNTLYIPLGDEFVNYSFYTFFGYRDGYAKAVKYSCCYKYSE